jgi:hypothetical protein
VLAYRFTFASSAQNKELKNAKGRGAALSTALSLPSNAPLDSCIERAPEVCAVRVHVWAKDLASRPPTRCVGPHRQGGEMIRTLSILDLFRRGRAESAFRIAPVAFVNSSVEEFVDQAEFYCCERPGSQARVRSKWNIAGDDGDRLTLSWTTANKERRPVA